MIPTLIKIDLTKRPEQVPGHQFHNRYHPDIPAIVSVKQNQVFKVECYEWGGNELLASHRIATSE